MSAARKETTSIAAVLPAVLHQARQRHGALQQAQQCWGQLVGKMLALHTAPMSLRKGRLIVHVDRSGDNYALSFQRQQLLAQLKERTQGAVEDLVIRIGDLPDATRVARRRHGASALRRR